MERVIANMCLKDIIVIVAPFVRIRFVEPQDALRRSRNLVPGFEQFFLLFFYRRKHAAGFGNASVSSVK